MENDNVLWWLAGIACGLGLAIFLIEVALK